MVFNRYLFKQLFNAMVFIAFTLMAVILLTQSLRFLELVIDSGASSGTFWILTLLALPRFFEIILPIALVASIIFIYNKLSLDSEIVVMRSAGCSPASLARPALILSAVAAGFLLVMTMWAGPKSLYDMQHLRQVVKAQYSTLLFREGVFNNMIDNLTVFIRNRTPDGEMHGLLIHDTRKENEDGPVTVIAKRGVIIPGEKSHQVVVYDGARQSIDEERGTLNRLDFQRYTLDLPSESGPVRQRWQEPDERTIFELVNPDMTNKRDRESRRDFIVEIHRRVVSPLLAPAFALLTLGLLLIGPSDRRGQNWRIAAAIGTTVLLQGLYLAAFNLSRQSDWGLALMYAIVLTPLGLGAFLLSPYSETLRRRLLFRPKSSGQDSS